MIGVNEVGIRWKDNTFIRGGLTDVGNSCFYKEHEVQLAVKDVSRGHSTKAHAPKGKGKSNRAIANDCHLVIVL